MKVKLKELGKISTGNTPSKNVAEFYDSEDIGFVKPDVISDSQVDYIENTMEYLTEIARNKARIVKKDAVFVTCVGSIGKIGIAKNKEFAFNQQINAIEPNEKVLPQYLAYGIFANKRKLHAIANAPVVPIINKTQFGDFEIEIIDDIQEQLMIVEVLDKVSEIIVKRKAELEKLDELIKARFVEMFGDPIENGMHWKQVPLSFCIERIENGKSFVCDSEARQGEWPAILKLSAVTYGFYRPKENKALLNENQFVEEAAVRVSDLLFTRKNTPELVGMCAYVYDTPPKLMMPDLLFRLNTTPACNKVFLWKLINHDLFRGRIKAIATGSAKSMSNISKERLLNLEIILPPLEIQEQFAAFVEQIDKSKAAVQKALDQTQLLFDSLMQEYFG